MAIKVSGTISYRNDPLTSISHLTHNHTTYKNATYSATAHGLQIK